MTRKDYVLIADALVSAAYNTGAKVRGEGAEAADAMLTEVVNALCHDLQRDNPRFSAGQFRKYISDRLSGR
jgi:hypothetical protein